MVKKVSCSIWVGISWVKPLPWSDLKKERKERKKRGKREEKEEIRIKKIFYKKKNHSEEKWKEKEEKFTSIAIEKVGQFEMDIFDQKNYFQSLFWKKKKLLKIEKKYCLKLFLSFLSFFLFFSFVSYCLRKT